MCVGLISVDSERGGQKFVEDPEPERVEEHDWPTSITSKDKTKTFVIRHKKGHKLNNSPGAGSVSMIRS